MFLFFFHFTVNLFTSKAVYGRLGADRDPLYGLHLAIHQNTAMLKTATLTRLLSTGKDYFNIEVGTYKATGLLWRGIFIHATAKRGGIATGYTLTHHRSGCRIACFHRPRFALACAKALSEVCDFDCSRFELLQKFRQIKGTIRAFQQAEDIELGRVDDGLELAG
ncbi:MAG: hypothetical protein HC816_21805 [Leptolyngbyaceae cyanobacterium RM1_1_2]|nr:hypothetical protein [Leptolyngbyaceae cyanobacterium RM1_1_2]